MNADFEVVVVGAGVIGLAVARAFALAGRNVLVLEAAAVAGTETSSRNSEVIHAGIYYPQGTMKARFCVQGRKQLYDFCASRGVAAKSIGKLIVATSPSEEVKLQGICERARSNNVTDLEWLTSQDVAALEPEIKCTKALLSPSTGIVDSDALMLAMAGEAENRGALFSFNTRFAGASKQDAFVIVAIGNDGTRTEVTSNIIVNCAGHGAHAVALAVEGIASSSLPPRYLARGHYCSVSGSSPFRHLIYPVPVNGALGIHATLDMSGGLRFGPDIEWISELDYALPPDLPSRFASAVKSYWPGVHGRILSPSYSGIRPKIHGPECGFADFCIQGEHHHGIPGLINLFGIESPGLTASLAIADYVLALGGSSCSSIDERKVA